MNRREALFTLPLVAAAAKADTAGTVVRRYEPANLEPPFGEQTGLLTPTERHFVRSHYATPKTDASTHALEISGAVKTPAKWTLAELAKLPQVAKPVTLECAGNGRVFLVPAATGLQWQLGGVGTAEWGGVRLSTLLENTGVSATATEIILVGADSGAIAEPATPGVIHFDRSIPVAKMKDVILATHMNGAPLTPQHGAPLRAVVAGYYGMASVKWLTRIVVSETPYDGYWQTMDYSTWERRDGGLATLKPVGPMLIKSQIARPVMGETIKGSDPFTIRGYAWGGDESVAKVEVSVDGGVAWNAAKLLGDEKPHCWREWEYAWTPTVKGSVKLLSRCYDAAGRTQPEKRDPDRRSVQINHLVPVEVTVR